jgi:tetratricopeptide (TPR) repeat protein
MASAVWTHDAYQCAQDLDVELAIQHCTRALESGELSRRERADTHLNRAYQYGRKGDFDQAIEEYSRSLDLARNSALAFRNRGSVYVNKGQDALALQDFDQAIWLDPHDAGTFVNRGNLYLRRGEFDRAFRDWDEAIRLDPNQAVAFNSRGGARLLVKREVDEALADLDRAVHLDPRNSEFLGNRGAAYVYKRDLGRAMRDLDEAIRLDPNRYLPFVTRGFVHLLRDEVDLAQQDYERAVGLAPQIAAAYGGRAFTHFRRGWFTAAASDFTRATNLDPSDSYWVLRSYTGEMRAGSKRLDLLRVRAATLDLAKWPGPIISMYLGQMGLHEVLGLAQHPDPAVQQEQLCQAYFYGGEDQLMQRREDEAIPMLQRAAVGSECDGLESIAARSELGRLPSKAR